MSDAVTRVTNYAYDFRRRRIQLTGELNTREDYQFDNQGRLTRVEKKDTSGGSPVLIRRETMEYDNLGRIFRTSRFAVNPGIGSGLVGNALVDDTWYDASGNVMKQRFAGAAALHKFRHDGARRMTRRYLTFNPADTSYSAAGAITTDTVVKQEEFGYDAASNLTQQATRERFHNATGAGELTTPSGTQPQARVSYLAFWPDAIGREQARADYGTNGAGTFTRPTTIPVRSDTVLVTSTSYNAAGEAETVTDPAGNKVKSTLDDAGRLITRIEDEGSSPHSNRETQFTYNLDGRLRHLTAKNAVTGDQITKFVYGVSAADGSEIASNDLLRGKIYPDSTDPESLAGTDHVEFKVNRQGEVKEIKDQLGTIRKLDYDKLGRLQHDRASTLGTNVDGTVRRISRTYNPLGLLDKITSWNNEAPGSGLVTNEIQNVYGDFGELIREYQEHSGAVNTGSSAKVQYGYGNGSRNHARLQTMIYPNNRMLHFDHGGTDGANDSLNRVSALRDGLATLITGVNLTSDPLRNNFSGWVGLKFTVGPTPLVVVQLGRWIVSGNNGTHTLKLVQSDGTNVAEGSTTLNTSGHAAGGFAYATLASPVTLAANTTYYLVSEEVNGGDQWHDFGSQLTPNHCVTLARAVYNGGSGYVDFGSSGHCYGPVDLRFRDESLAGSVTPSATLRNNFSGWVGLQLVVGASPIVVTELGRWVVNGNSGTHTIKLVDSNGVDVPGGSVNVSMSGQAAGRFAWVALAHPLSLEPNTTYYLVSEEVNGGDQWYEWDTLVTYSGEARVASAASFSGGYASAGGPGNSFGPVSLRYNTVQGAKSLARTVAPTNPRNNATGWVGLKLLVRSMPLVITELGRWVVNGNSGSHVVKLVNSNGTDVAGGSVTVNTAGKPAGAFAFASLASPVTLAANTPYFLVSEEVNGGDQWHEYTTALTGTGAADFEKAVYNIGSGYVEAGATGNSYGPVNLRYRTPVFVDYSYLGAETIIRADYSGEPGVELTYIKQGGESNGDAGDPYTGLDRFGRVVDQRWLKTRDGTHRERVKYGYDRVKNRKWRQNVVAGTWQDEFYTYDTLYQLKTLDRGTLNAGKTGINGTPAWEEDFNYDPTGNWHSPNTWAYETKASGTSTLLQGRSHNKANEIDGLSGVAGTVWSVPAFNAAGNSISMPKPAVPTTAYSARYDAWNRLVQLDAGSAGAYAYDGLHRRISKTISSNTRHFYYSKDWQVLEERMNALTTADRQFVLGLRYFDDLILRDRGAERLYVLHDFFHPTAIINTGGAVQERYGYDAFGYSRVMSPSFGGTSSSYEWETRFGAYRWDAESNLYYVRHRYLHPKLGRWITRDRLDYSDGTNLYLYVRNAPINYIDLRGEQTAVPSSGGSKSAPRNTRQSGIRTPTGVKKCNQGWADNFHGFIAVDDQGYGFYPRDTILSAIGVTRGAILVDDVVAANCRELYLNDELYNVLKFRNCVERKIDEAMTSPPHYNYPLNNCRHWRNNVFDECLARSANNFFQGSFGYGTSWH